MKVSDTAKAFMERITGMDELSAQIAAEETGWIVRVVEVDGKSFMYAEDYRTDRLNFKVKDKAVIEVSVG